MNNNDLIKNKIKQNYEFTDLFKDQVLLNKLGITKIEFEKRAGMRNGRQYRVEDNTFSSSRIVVFPYSKTDIGQFFQNETYTQDKGDVFQFVKNRIPSKSMWEAVKILKDHVPNLENIKLEIPEFKKNNIRTYTFDKEKYISGNLTSVVDYEEQKEHFLTEKRFLKQSTLEDPLFKNKVYLYEPFKGNKNRKNAFFPKFNDEGVMKGAEIKFPPPEKKTDEKKSTNMVVGDPKLLWTSNRPEVVDQVILTESAIDAISRHQEFGEPNTFYISSNGNLYKDRIEQVFHILDREGLKDVPIYAGHDNDKSGFEYDLRITNQFLDPMEEFSYIRDKNGVGVKFSVRNESSLPNLKETQEYFETIKEKVNNELLKKPSLNEFSKVENRTLSTTVYLPNEDVMNKFSVNISKGINQKLSFVQQTNLKIIRPPRSFGGNIKDWNDYTKKMQLENPEPKTAKNKSRNKGYTKQNN